MKDENYFDIPLISYSALSKFDKEGPRSINKPFENADAEYFILGHAVEELIQGDMKSFNKKFIVTDNVKPTASLGLVADAMVENNIKATPEEAIAVAKMLGLWSSVKKEDVFRAKVDVPQLWEYLKLEKSKKNKMLLSSEAYLVAQTMAKSVSEHEFTKNLVNPDEKGVDLLPQVVIIWKNGKFKSKLDWIRVDHNKKEIVPIDLKTGAVAKEDFIRQFFKLRYDIQAAMYHDAVLEWAFENYPDYSIEPFKYIYISKIDPLCPITFTITDETLLQGRDGREVEGRLVRKGYVQLAEEYDWHLANNSFSYSKEAYESSGNILI